MTDVEKKVVELEQQYWQALMDKDVEKVLQLTADPCLITGAQGVISLDHATYRKMMEQEATYELLEFSIDEMQTSAVTPEVVTTAYKVTENMVVEGKPLTLKAADSTTWARQGDRWVCVLHTEAILGDAFGRDRKAPPAKKKLARKRPLSGRTARRSSR